MIPQNRNKYVQNSIQTATPAQLLVMLYDGAIKFTKQAMECINKKQMMDAHRNIMKVQDIVQEFVITLDHNAPVAEGLLKLYDYFMYLLIQANVKKDVKPLEELLVYLNDLKETWVQAARLASAQKSTVGGKNG